MMNQSNNDNTINKLHINLFQANAPFFTPWKHEKTRGFIGVKFNGEYERGNCLDITWCAKFVKIDEL